MAQYQNKIARILKKPQSSLIKIKKKRTKKTMKNKKKSKKIQN